MSPTDLMLLLVIGSSIFVYFDAKSIGVKKGQVQGIADMGPGEWFFACLLLWIIAFPLYIGTREKFKKINDLPTIHPNVKNDINEQISNGAGERKCPYCAETIKREAIVCRFCGRDLNVPIPASANQIGTSNPNSLLQPEKSAIRLCPKCNIPMAIKVANQGQYQGRKFYVCPNYKKCQQVVPIEQPAGDSTLNIKDKPASAITQKYKTDSNPTIPKVQPNAKKPSSLLSILIIIFMGLFILIIALQFYNPPDATQCIRVDHCREWDIAGNAELLGSITNTCDKSITNITLQGSVFSNFDNLKLGEVSALQEIVLAPGLTYRFDLIEPNTYYGEYFVYCKVNAKSAYFVK